MKIVEALKELKLFQKRMLRQIIGISKYSSKLSNEKPFFASDEEQAKEVQTLVQANQDLARNYLRLKKNLDYTNLMSTLIIGNETATVADFPLKKRVLGGLLQKTYTAMNDSEAETRPRNNVRTDGPQPAIERLYDEKKKNQLLRELQDQLDSIDGKLEVFNATTDLIEHF